MTEFRFPPVLSIAAWEAEFDDPDGAPAGDLPGGFAPGGPHLDFGRVEYVEFGVLARALLMLDAAVAAGVGATVTLPVHELEQGSRQSRYRAGRRGQARAFMRQAGFQEAPHWPVDAVRVRAAGSAGKGEDVDEPPTGDLAAGRAGPAVEPLGHRRRLLPLQWLQPLEGAGLRESARYLALEQGLGDLGLPTSDARAISETVLAELIGNAARAAASHDPGQSRVLVGAQLHDAAADAGTAASPDDGTGDGANRVLRLFAGSAARPDTLFEATIPVGTRFAAPDGHWSGHPALNRSHRLGWIGATLDPERGLGEADRAAFTAAVSTAAVSRARGGVGAAVSGTRTCGVVVTVATGSEQASDSAGTLRQAVRRTLAVLAPGADRAAVAAVFPDLGRQVLESCVTGHDDAGSTAGGNGTGLHAAGLHGVAALHGVGLRGAAAKQPARVMLVLGAQGEPLWYGGSAAMRAVLDRLTQAGGVLPLAEAKRCWSAAGAPGDDFDKALRANKHLFTAEDASLVLLLSPLQVLRALTDAAQHELSGAALRGGPGVQLGLFRAPTLTMTNRWIDAGKLVKSTIGLDVAAFTLARAVQAELAALPYSHAPLVIAPTHNCPPRLATRLSECLGLGDRTYPAGAELDLGGWPTAGVAPSDSRVVLCTDVILTENTVRRAVADIVEHAEPVAIACAVDARVERGPVRVLNREIPVVTLAEIDLAVPTLETGPAVVPAPTTDPALATLAVAPTRDIDPISLRPVAPRPDDRLPMSEEELLYWCSSHPESPAGALRLGHLEYARRVHGSATVDVDRLFRNEDARIRITDALIDTVQRGLARVHHHADRTRPEDAIQVWHPGDARENAGRLAHEVWSQLAAAGHQVNPPFAFHRLGSGPAWLTTPSAIDRPARPRTVVILDYLARTGGTLRQMIRHAVSAGAERVVAVVLIDHQLERERGLLGAVSAIRREATDGADTMRGSDVPIVVRYISAAGVGGVDAHECGVCATYEKYADLGEAPDRLRRHADRLRDMLRPRRRDELFESSPSDLFGVPLFCDEATDYLRWRALLRRSQHETGARYALMDRLAALGQSAPDSSWGRRGLIRLLAAEHDWLKLPPLRYAAAREPLARCCLDELDSPAPEPPWLRAQAVMVLAAAAPERFVANLPALVESGADDPVVIDQVCLEAYRLARRPHRDRPVDSGVLRDALEQSRDRLETSRTGWDHRRNEGSAAEGGVTEQHAHVVRQLILLTQLPPRPQLDDPREAWARLAEQWCEPAERHRFESRLLRVRDFVEDLQLATPTRERSATAEADLRECARLVEERVLSFLPPLRGILAGQHTAELFGRPDQERFVALADTSAAGLLDLSERLSALLREPGGPAERGWRTLRRDLLDRIGWWYAALFATHRPGTGASALLVDLVRSAPAPVGEVVGAAVADRALEDAVRLTGDLDVRVFCPRDLLGQAVGQVLDDALARAAAANGDAGGKPRIEVSLRRPGLDGVQIVVRDSSVSALSNPAEPGPGTGIDAGVLARSLEPFGARIASRAGSNAERQSHETVIALRPWREV